nr:retrotransposon protein, putative, Ty1-copia subclass [Tanacetum cinerariifolium]
IRAGKVQKGNKHKKSHSQTAAKGHNHGKGKNKQAYAPKLKIPPPPKRENPAKDSICHECGEIWHWKRNYPHLNHEEDDLEIDEPQSDIVPIHRSTRTRHAPNPRLVAKGFTQNPGIDYEETFSSVVDIRAIRILIAIAAYYDYEIWQINVKTAFLNGYLNEEYSNATKCKTYLGKCFAMKDLGEAAYILEIKIYRDRSKRLIGLCQSAYIEKILKRYCMENSKRRSIPMQEKLKLSKSQGASTPAEIKCMQNVPYASAVGSIMYAVRCTRPDVAFAQNITSRFQQNLGDIHWTTVKNILKYLRNTKDMFLVYGGDLKRELRISCYTDAGYLTDADDLKSQTGYLFVLNGGAIDWKSAKQSIFSTSSAEAGYIAAFNASKEAVWVRKFISGMSVVPTIEEPISMYCDNTGAIAIANESGITKGVRHFRAKVHYLQEVIEFGDIKLEKFHTDDNLADPFTKALAFPKHFEHTKNIGMLPASSLM